MKADQLAIHSISTGGASLADRFTAYAAAGFTNVELFLPQVHSAIEHGESAASVRRMLEDAGLQCIGGHQMPLKCFADGKEADDNHAQLAANAALLGELGASTMVVGTDGAAEALSPEASTERIAASLAALGRRVTGTGVTVCLEFNWSPVVRSLSGAVEAARASAHDQVGVLFDPAHYHCGPSKLERIDATRVPWIRHVHLNDMADKPGEWSRCNGDRVLPGRGCLDLAAILDRLEANGYRGHYAVEMFDEVLWKEEPRTAATAMYQSLRPYCASTSP